MKFRAKFTWFGLFVAAILPGVFAHVSFASPLETGVAVTEPVVLRPLEKTYGIGKFIPVKSGEIVIDNSLLMDAPSFKPVIATLDKELAEYAAKTPGSGVGMRFSKRLFNMEFLKSGLARFVLVGIVNRQDRAFISPATCGEVRFIYRLAYNVADRGSQVASRLPMTLNLVLNAKPEGSTLTCADIAKRWTTLSETMDSSQVESLILGNMLGSIKQLEMNLQIVRWPAAVRPDFGGHAEYLLKVFKFDPSAKVFSETVLENQIDRAKLLADPALVTKFKAWLKQPAILKELDKGTALIPEEFLARRAFTSAPGGMSRSANRPLYGIVTTDELKALDYSTFDQIKSGIGMYRRLNDMSCVGCHQTRAIGGFHFMGKDPSNKYPGNSVFVPASAHFFADLPRRKDIVIAISENRAADYSRGFTNRPQEFRSKELLGTGLLNGWGAHCSNSDDPTLRSMTCAAGLRCRVQLKTKVEPDSGICVPDGRQEIGDPLESGVVIIEGYGKEKYTPTVKDELPSPKEIHVASPQGGGGGTGGFPGGMIRRTTCENLPKEAVCGALPAARSGFNSCLGGKNFLECINEYSIGVGLRGCDQKNPCRDDYICSMSFESTRGACVPPYFLFQFRVDGHPVGKAQAK
ncbi:MAG: hypothetical protein V4692_16685 [Bdellovibrionota bacterium]